MEALDPCLLEVPLRRSVSVGCSEEGHCNVSEASVSVFGRGEAVAIVLADFSHSLKLVLIVAFLPCCFSMEFLCNQVSFNGRCQACQKL